MGNSCFADHRPGGKKKVMDIKGRKLSGEILYNQKVNRKFRSKERLEKKELDRRK